MKKAIAVKWIAVAVLLWCPQVWGQCPPNGGIAPNQTTYSLMMPSDAASLGRVTATEYGLVSNVSGGLPSHNMTVTPGTQIGFAWASNNGSTATMSYYANGGSTPYYTTSLIPNSQGNSLNGSNTNVWSFGQSDVGSYYTAVFKVTASNGSTTQDRITVNVVAGSSPSIVSQDEIPTNLYYEATASFSGTSNMACGACQQNPQACSNVTHQPSISFSFANLTSEETQTQPTIYGQPVNPTFNNGMSSNPLYLSVLPGDTTQDTETEQVDCSLEGIFFNQSPKDPTSGYTHKQMKTKIKVVQQGSTTAGVTRWYVDTWCKDTQHTPIWEPIYIDTKGAATILISVGQYEMSYGDCWAEPGWPAWKCAPMTVTPPQPLTIGVGGTKYDCSTLINTPIPQ